MVVRGAIFRPRATIPVHLGLKRKGAAEEAREEKLALLLTEMWPINEREMQEGNGDCGRWKEKQVEGKAGGKGVPRPG